MNQRLCAGACAAALVAGCAVGPDYHRPPLEVPAQYRETTAGAAPAREAASVADSGWWEVYSDADLKALLARAIQSSFDVKIAAARIDQARAQLGSARMEYLPQVSVAATAQRAKTSQYIQLPGAPRIVSEDQVQILASYQLDLWGQLRRTNEAARANLLGSQYAARAVQVTLVATIANDYFELISLDSELEITRRTVVEREKFLELTHAQHERGYVTGLDVATAEAQLAAARATVPDLERQITQIEDQVSVLLGTNPGPVVRSSYGEAVPEAPPQPPTGLPAQLLERRPDVALAEQGLVAANAQVGVAKAALFPNITLTGSSGSLSVPFTNLLTGPAAEWTAGVALIQPLLNVQSNLYQVDLADARKREAVFQYGKAVQAAFQDVADALIEYRTYGEEERQQVLQVDALRRARAIALARYKMGYVSYFDVIQADRDLFVAELALAQAYANNMSALVHLYSALGGGWQQQPAG
ncbi:MAG TPA: efflux transporter outer membrane subunit [Steroidobacteraceae bacterium]|jgi:multidrug efflux system outer membrane protein